MMFCSDDKHPDSLVAGHINVLCTRAVKAGIPVMKVLKAACINPVLHYKMQTGLLRVGDEADFIRVKNLEEFTVMETFIRGKKVAENGETLIRTNISREPFINHFNCKAVKEEAFVYHEQDIPLINGKLPVIGAADGQLVTTFLSEHPCVSNGKFVGDTGRDILKIVVINRYQDAPVAKGFIKNIGLKKGAIASSVAHDSHNIVAIGADDASLCRAVNLVIAEKGGIAIAAPGIEEVLALPLGGLMSPEDGYQVAAAYTRIDQIAKEIGSTLQAPFMTLSFMALLVIPSLKMSDLGIFDGDQFTLLQAVPQAK
jgi:adenine deaminase